MFSVIIPTYNRADLLKECLQSLFEQSFKAFEVLVCDDGSTDDTFEVINLFQDRLEVRYLFQENSGGPAAPRNLGIAHAKHDWICFLDSDDLWSPNKLEKISKIIDNNEIDLVCHLFLNSKNQKIGFYKKNLFFTFYEDLLMNGNRIVNSSICVRKSLIPEISEDRNLIGVEDYNLLLDIAKNTNRVYCLKEVLGFYSIHENNISSDFLKQIEKMEYMFNKQDNENKYLNQRVALLDYLRASFYFNNNKDLARNILLRSIKNGSYVIKIKSIIKLIIK